MPLIGRLADTARPAADPALSRSISRRRSPPWSACAQIPADAFMAEILGTERGGHGVFIRDNGLVLTIGYLITEARRSGCTQRGPNGAGPRAGLRPGDRLGPVQALARLDVPLLPVGDSRAPSR